MHLIQFAPIQVHRPKSGFIHFKLARIYQTVRSFSIYCYGKITFNRTDIAKKITIPEKTIAIDLYLQCRILEMGYQILYREKAMVYFTPPSTLRDFASQVLRSRNGHRQISTQVKRLGINAPLWSVLMAVVKTTYSNPIDAFFMLLCSCLLPFYSSTLPGTDSVQMDYCNFHKRPNQLDNNFFLFMLSFLT